MAGDEDVGEAAALCINFMVRSREDMAFGALPGVLALDMLAVLMFLALKEDGNAIFVIWQASWRFQEQSALVCKVGSLSQVVAGSLKCFARQNLDSSRSV
jgi:hypothetical protein